MYVRIYLYIYFQVHDIVLWTQNAGKIRFLGNFSGFPLWVTFKDACAHECWGGVGERRAEGWVFSLVDLIDWLGSAGKEPPKLWVQGSSGCQVGHGCSTSLLTQLEAQLFQLDLRCISPLHVWSWFWIVPRKMHLQAGTAVWYRLPPRSNYLENLLFPSPVSFPLHCSCLPFLPLSSTCALTIEFALIRGKSLTYEGVGEEHPEDLTSNWPWMGPRQWEAPQPIPLSLECTICLLFLG